MEIKLVETSPAHAEFLAEGRKDPDMLRFNPLVPTTLEELREQLSKVSSDWSEFDRTESFCWLIEVDTQLAGHVILKNINRMMLTAEIGYGISAEARGKGIATKVVQMFTRQVYEHTPLRKIMAFVHWENVASQKVLEKVGYKKEGLLREHYLIAGEPVDEIIYGILRRECL